jgi:hypothetical protein
MYFFELKLICPPRPRLFFNAWHSSSTAHVDAVHFRIRDSVEASVALRKVQLRSKRVVIQTTFCRSGIRQAAENPGPVTGAPPLVTQSRTCGVGATSLTGTAREEERPLPSAQTRPRWRGNEVLGGRSRTGDQCTDSPLGLVDTSAVPRGSQGARARGEHVDTRDLVAIAGGDPVAPISR